MSSVGWRRLLRDSVDRFRAAEGFTHARGVAFQITLTFIPALIAAIGVVADLGRAGEKGVVRRAMLSLTPGAMTSTVKEAFRQGTQLADSEAFLAFGIIAALTSATVAMAQFERGANRLYGVERDRPLIARYARAGALALSAGSLIALGYVLFVAGSALRGTSWSDALVFTWAVGRWLVAVAVVWVAYYVLYRYAPMRGHRRVSWLVVGATVGVILWAAFTLGLAGYLALSSGFGKVYGPLAGLIGLLAWSYLSAVSMFGGLALCAQLELAGTGKRKPVV